MSLPYFNDYDLTLTLDGYNITNEPVRNLFEHGDLTYDIFYPARHTRSDCEASSSLPAQGGRSSAVALLFRAPLGTIFG